VQRAAADIAPGGDAPAGWLRLSFESFDALRAARPAARRWLAATTGVRGWIESGALRSLAGDESRPAIDIWCSAGTAQERRALAARAKARLASALPGRLIDEGAPPQVEWRIAPRASRISASGLDVDEAIDAALGGFDVGSLQIPGVEAGIRLLAAPDDDLALVPVRSAAGTAAPVVPLATQASLRRVSGTAAIERHDGSPAVRLIVRGAAASDVSTVRRALRKVAVGPGERIDVMGVAAE
jgi:multidrug efflux pump subunit AcrB